MLINLSSCSDITEFISNIVCQNQKLIFGIGSSTLRSYLPESDIDLTYLTENPSGNDDIKSFRSVFDSLFSAINGSNDINSTAKDMVIRNIEYVNARTNVVHCVVNSTNVDITINQIGAFGSLIFLEEVDRCIGLQNLFKRSVILIKVKLNHTKHATFSNE